MFQDKFQGKWIRFVAFAFCLLSTTSCGKNSTYNPPRNGRGVTSPSSDGTYTPSPHIATRTKIQYSSTLSYQARSILDDDFEFLKSIEMSKGTELSSLMEIIDTRPQSLTDWLDARVKILVSKNYDYSSYLRFSGTLSLVDTEPVSATVAQNLGAVVYLSMIRTGKRGYLTVPGFGEIKIESPRVGIVQEGDGFLADFIGGGDLEDIPHRLARLGVFFHEARHSDGNGESLCFTHIRCPFGHDMAGEFACDNNNNGPYRIGAEFTRTFLDSNPGLSARHRIMLRTLVSDSLSRIQSYRKMDATPAGRY